jgi:citrate synthase
MASRTLSMTWAPAMIYRYAMMQCEVYGNADQSARWTIFQWCHKGTRPSSSLHMSENLWRIATTQLHKYAVLHMTHEI